MGKICGIAGVLLRKDVCVGKLLIAMMEALQHRGIDSSGVAIYSKDSLASNEYILRMFTLDVIGAASKVSTAIAKAGGDIRSIHLYPVSGGHGFDRYQIKADPSDLRKIIDGVNSTDVARVVSVGRCMEIFKDVCSVTEFSERFKTSELNGTHGLGHVRFSTESQVNLLHAHPFQTFDYPDIAVVHNGQITNYYKVRERLERRGHIFETENDSELIVHYVTDKLERGLNLKESLGESVTDLDGPFSYIISTSEALGIARDKLGLRPALVLEGDELSAAASEEGALRALEQKGVIRNLRPGEVVTWQR